MDPSTLQVVDRPQKRPPGRPPLHASEASIQRRRERDRIRQARKRERDRAKRRNSDAVAEEESPGVVSLAGNSVANPRDSYLVGSLDRRGGLRPSSFPIKIEASKMKAEQRLDRSVGLRLQIEGPGSFPGGNGEFQSGPDSLFPPTAQDALLFSTPIAPRQIPVSLENAIMTTSNSFETCEEEPDDSPMIWHTIQRIVQALEASRSSRAMREQLAGALYTSDFIRLTDNWEAAGIIAHSKPLLPPTANIATLSTLPPDFSGNNLSTNQTDFKQGGLTEKILDKMGERMIAIRKRRVLKEVEELKRALAEKEAILKECDALLESGKAELQNL